jgi:hypothetical protein
MPICSVSRRVAFSTRRRPDLGGKRKTCRASATRALRSRLPRRTPTDWRVFCLGRCLPGGHSQRGRAESWTGPTALARPTNFSGLSALSSVQGFESFCLCGRSPDRGAGVIDGSFEWSDVAHKLRVGLHDLGLAIVAAAEKAE